MPQAAAATTRYKCTASGPAARETSAMLSQIIARNMNNDDNDDEDDEDDDDGLRWVAI